MVHARLGIAEEKNVSVIGQIPFDTIFTKSMIQGQTIFEYSMESEAERSVKQIWEKSSKMHGI